jgi:multiple sugar transport system permease protein
MAMTRKNINQLPWQRMIRKGIIYVLVFVVLAYTLAPFLWLIISALMSRTEILNFPPHFIPQEPTLDNFKYLFVKRPPTEMTGELGLKVTKQPEEWTRGFRNSAIVSFCVTSIALFVGSLAAYSLARVRWPGKSAVIIGLIATRMIPGIATDLPRYMIFAKLRLIDTLPLLIALETSWLLPFTVFILYGVFQSIPKEIEDAGLIDGCTRLQTLYRIIWPLSTPGLVAAGTFAFLNTWNSFFTPLIFASMKAKTFILTISELVTEMDIDYSQMAAAGVIAAILPVALTLLFQRYVIQGLTAGGIKG